MFYVVFCIAQSAVYYFKIISFSRFVTSNREERELVVTRYSEYALIRNGFIFLLVLGEGCSIEFFIYLFCVPLLIHSLQV